MTKSKSAAVRGMLGQRGESGERKKACRGGSAALHSHLELRKFKIYKRKCYENVTWARISVRRVTHNSWLVLQRLSRGKVAWCGGVFR